jgi:hypothetical protein
VEEVVKSTVKALFEWRKKVCQRLLKFSDRSDGDGDAVVDDDKEKWNLKQEATEAA